MKHGSLFSGIGGFDLAAEWMGWENVFHCEWNEFGKKILKHYWPKSISYDDITKTDFTIHRGTIDVLSGGFPCQPYSLAGKRKGKEDDRHLWPEMLRVIREVSPTFVVGENVYGLVNWNGGLVFNEVQTDLEAEGYEVTAVILPAVSVNAPHRRDRVWFIAVKNTKCDGCIFGKFEEKRAEFWQQWDTGSGSSNGIYKQSNKQSTTHTTSDGLQKCEERREVGDRQSKICRTGSKFTNAIETNGKASDASYTTKQRLQDRIKRQGQQNDEENRGRVEFRAERLCIDGDTSDTTSNGRGENNWARESGFFNKKSKKYDWHNFPTQSPVCSGDDGIPSGLDGITFPKWRNESIKGYGNAIVPQVAYQIFKAIEEINQLMNNEEAKENL